MWIIINGIVISVRIGFNTTIPPNNKVLTQKRIEVLYYKIIV